MRKFVSTRCFRAHGDRMHPHAYERPAHVAAREELVDDGIHDACRQCGCCTAGECGGVDADDRTRGCNEWTTREAVVHRKIEPQQALDALTGLRLPAFANCAHDAEARRDVASRPADSEHQRANGARARLGTWCGSEGQVWCLQYDEIGHGVTSHDRGLRVVSVGKRDAHGAVAPHGVTRAHDDAVAPYDCARWNAAPCVDGDDV